jgi:hypothetical protein
MNDVQRLNAMLLVSGKLKPLRKILTNMQTIRTVALFFLRLRKENKTGTDNPLSMKQILF